MILLDPAHGGPGYPGLRGPQGLSEAEANLRLALAVRSALAGRLRVQMTRESDAWVPIRARARMAEVADATISMQFASREPIEAGEVRVLADSGRNGWELALALVEEIGDRASIRHHAGFLPQANAVARIISGSIENPATERAIREGNFIEALALGISSGLLRAMAVPC